MTYEETLMVCDALNSQASKFDADAERLRVPEKHPLRLGAIERRALTCRLLADYTRRADVGERILDGRA